MCAFEDFVDVRSRAPVGVLKIGSVRHKKTRLCVAACRADHRYAALYGEIRDSPAMRKEQRASREHGRADALFSDLVEGVVEIPRASYLHSLNLHPQPAPRVFERFF